MRANVRRDPMDMYDLERKVGGIEPGELALGKHKHREPMTGWLRCWPGWLMVVVIIGGLCGLYQAINVLVAWFR